jgi:hypothetical protein
MLAPTAEAKQAASISPATHPHLYHHRPNEFVGITTPTLIYIGVEDRAEFDRIALPLQDNGPNETGHVLVKSLGKYNGKKPTIIFQHWLLSPTMEGYRAIDAAKTGGAK